MKKGPVWMEIPKNFQIYYVLPASSILEYSKAFEQLGTQKGSLDIIS